LLGANRRYIEQHLPHIGQLVRADLAGVIADSEYLVVGLGGTEVQAALAAHVRPHHRLLDLVNLPGREKLSASVQGLCW
jgi:GDP-mannose 6-dehydrogenase